MASTAGELGTKILKCFKEIIDRLSNVDSITDYLISQGILALNDSERINYFPTSSEKARKLIHILLKKGEPALNCFMDALKESSQDHISKHITDSIITVIKEKGLLPQSDLVSEKETFKNFLEGCASQCMKVEVGCSINIKEACQYFQTLNEKNQWTHVVTVEAVMTAIQNTFPGLSSCSTAGSSHHIRGISWRPGAGEIKDDQKRPGETILCSNSSDITGCGPMETWGIQDVSTWLKSQNIPAEIIDAFLQEEIDGSALKVITFETIKTYVYQKAKVGPLLKLISARDSLISESDSEELPRSGTHYHSGVNTKALPSKIFDEIAIKEVESVHRKICTNIRVFGSEVSSTYEESTYFPPACQEINDPLQRVQWYNFPPDCRINNQRGITHIQEKAMEFASACANDRTNGTLYFGLGSDGEVLGITGDQSQIIGAMEDAVRLYFYEDEADRMFKCVHTPKFVPVKSNTMALAEMFILEFDVCPYFEACQEDVFWIRDQDWASDQKILYRFKNGEPSAVSVGETAQFMLEKNSLALQRKQKEKQKQQLSYLQKHDQDKIEKLKMLLCRGGKELGDVTPIVVTNAVSHEHQEGMPGKFHFMKNFNWEYVFDFDSDGMLYTYLDESEHQVYTVLPIDKFNTTDITCESYKYLENMFLTQTKKWLFSNGRKCLDAEPCNVSDWKKNRGKSFREATRLVKNCIPTGRAVVIFLLSSSDIGPMLEAADDLITEFENQWFTIAESDDVMEKWITGLREKHLIRDRMELIPRCITALSWTEINEVICKLSDNIDFGSFDVPSSVQQQVIVTEKTLNSLSDLQIVSSTHCKKAHLSEEKRASLSVESKQAFYRGSEANWWNFYFEHVVDRDCVSDIVADVTQRMTEPMEDGRVAVIDLFHQPGAGATTVAKHVLWKMKKICRCVVVHKITDQTAEQLQKVHNYKDSTPKPLLVLLDVNDDEAIENLKGDLEEKNYRTKDWELDHERYVFFVFLCTRRSSSKIATNKYSLEQKLTTPELKRFRRRFTELTKKFKETSDPRLDPKHLISFNIMKEDFSEEFINKTVSNLIAEISDGRELRLLKYVSMINLYDIGFQPLPVSAFDEVMQNHISWNQPQLLRPKWEEYMSMPLRTLLTKTHGSGPMSGRHIRIIHGKVSEKVLNHLMEVSDMQLADIFEELLHVGIFRHQYRNRAVQFLLKVVCDVVKKRVRDRQTNIPDSRFAPLIEDILKSPSQGINGAITITQKVYELSDDVFVGQQLARLYIHCKNWNEARTIGKQITDKMGNNPFLWDTYGLSYLEPLKSRFDKLARFKCIKPNQLIEVIHPAMEVMQVFQRMQIMCENTPHKDTAGYRHELDTIQNLLSCLAHVEGLDSNKLRDVLTGVTQMPEPIKYAIGEDLTKRIFNLQYRADFAIARMEYHNSDNHKYGKYYPICDPSQFQQNIGFYFKSDMAMQNLTEDQACNIRRGQVNAMLGRTYWSVAKLSREKGGKKKLEYALALLENNVYVKMPKVTDIRQYLNVNLALCCADASYQAQCVHQKLAEYAKFLYRNRASLPYMNVEPFFHAALLNWPSQTQLQNQNSMPASEVVALLDEWRLSHQKEYPAASSGRYPKPEIKLVFIGVGFNMLRFVFYSQLRNVSWDRPLNESRECVQRLQWFRGTLLDRGAKVRLEVSECGNMTSIDIGTYRQDRNRCNFNKTVFFAIVFTWAGPKAIGITMEDPRR